jgi:copper chaperone CopZ
MHSAVAAPGLPSATAQTLLRIGGIYCAACADTLEAALLAVPGVVRAQVVAASALATVQWLPACTRPSLFVAAVQRAGYSATVQDAGTSPQAAAQQQAEQRQALWRLFVAVLCGMQVMMLAAPAYFSAPGDLAPDLKRLMDWAAWLLTVPVLVFAAAPFFKAHGVPCATAAWAWTCPLPWAWWWPLGPARRPRLVRLTQQLVALPGGWAATCTLTRSPCLSPFCLAADT